MPKLNVRLFLLSLLLLILPKMQIAEAAPSECQDIWRVDSHAVARLAAGEQHFAKLAYYRWENNRWQASDAETFFNTQQPDIPLIIFAPGYSVTTQQITQLGLSIAQNFDPDKPCRLVLWSWYADRGIGNIRRDIRSKLPIVHNTADYLALFLQKVNPQSKVCLFGFSFGSRIICNAVEAWRTQDPQPERLRLRLVLSGAATDQDWFAQGHQHGKVPEVTEKILITYNSNDWALRFYPFLYNYRHRPTALGLRGLPMQSVAPELRSRFENVDVNPYIGNRHETLSHVQTTVFRSRINTYFFFE